MVPFVSFSEVNKLIKGEITSVFEEFFDTGVTTEHVASDSTPEVSAEQPRLL